MSNENVFAVIRSQCFNWYYNFNATLRIIMYFSS